MLREAAGGVVAGAHRKHIAGAADDALLSSEMDRGAAGADDDIVLARQPVHDGREGAEQNCRGGLLWPRLERGLHVGRHRNDEPRACVAFDWRTLMISG